MGSEFHACKNCGKDFSVTPDELGMYERLEMPQPKICVQCRWQRHLSFWVFGKFRKGTSALSGESLITVLPENTRYPIYTSKEWFGDAWDAMDYGVDYDPARPFFDQLKDLQSRVPRPHQVGRNNTNSDWCDDAWESKNCYLSRSMLKCEELLYGYRNVNVKNSSDTTYCYDCERCYDLTYCFKCFHTRHSFNCQNVINGNFLIDCNNTQDSFMCWNLRNKQYCIRNVEYTKDEYKAELAKINFGSRKVIVELKKEFEEILKNKAVHREHFNLRTTESTGNYLTNCKKCVNAFHWEDAEDCYNTMRGLKNKGVIDFTNGFGNELVGNAANSFQGYMSKYCSGALHCRYSEYLDDCLDCEYCFGCVGLKKKKYCILNKQYSEEDYSRQLSLVKGQMLAEGTYGDFLPMSMVPGGYNVSSAQVYFPLTREEASAKSFLWEEVADTHVDGISPDTLPDDIKDAKDEITTQALVCPETHYRFNIAPRELEFYRMMQIPLPRTHSDHRNLARFAKLTVIQAYPYQCVYCGKETMAYYPLEWGYKRIACEVCYQREIS